MTPRPSGIPKKLRQRRKLHDTAPVWNPKKAEEEEIIDEEPPTSEAGPLNLSRGQRKRQAKRMNFERKFDFVQYQLKEKSGEVDESALGDLVDISAELKKIQQQAEKTFPASTKDSRARRSAQSSSEMKQFEAVLNFQPFQQDPFGALQAHLTNSVEAQKTKAEKKKQKEKKK